MKWKPSATIRRDPQIPWFVVVKFPYQAQLVEAIRSLKLPGATYQPASKSWLWPIECVELVIQTLKEYGCEIKCDLSDGPIDPQAVPPGARGIAV